MSPNSPTQPATRLLLRILTWPVGRALGRLLLLLAAMAYFGCAILIIGMRYWILPDIEAYRVDIEQAASLALGRRITIERVEADWRGLMPYLALRRIAIYDEANRPALELGLVESTISWSSLWHFGFRQHALEIWRPNLTVRRDKTGQIYVAGIPLSKDNSGSSGTADWLLGQNEIAIRDADINWIDEQRAAPPLALGHVDFVLRNDGARHRFALRAQPPREHASAIELKGDLRGESATDLTLWKGRVFADIAYADLAAWRAWVDYPVDLTQGRGGLRVWAEISGHDLRDLVADLGLADVVARLGPDRPVLELGQLQGRLRFRYADSGYTVAGNNVSLRAQSGIVLEPADFSLKVARAPAKEGGDLRANGVDLYKLSQLAEFLPLDPALHGMLARYAPQGRVFGLSYKWEGPLDKPQKFALQSRFSDIGVRAEALRPGVSGISGNVTANESGGSLALDSRAAAIDLPAVFAEPRIPIEKLAAAASWRVTPAGVDVDVRNLDFANDDAAGTASGSYRMVAGGPGIVDLTAQLTRASASRVPRYMPLRVRETTRSWLERALVAGTSKDVRFRLKGDLSRFPFPDDKEGIFQVVAIAQGGKLDYAPNWPPIDNISAEVAFHGRRMEINATRATVLGTRVGRARVDIPDLSSPLDKVLNVSGNAEGPTAEFLRFIDSSPVAALVDDFTHDMRAVGEGKLQLKMALPLPVLPGTKPKIAGSYQFIANQLLPEPSLPPISQLNGRVEFTESGVSARSLTGMFLGGPTTINMSTRADSGITVLAQGTASMQNLQSALDMPWLKKFSGSSPWKASISVRKRAVDIAFDSPLTDIASELPEPLHKPAGEPMPLRVERHVVPADAPPRNGAPLRQETWQLTLGKVLSAQWVARVGRGGTEIVRAGFGVNEPAQMPARGVVIGGKLATLDVDQWRDVSLLEGESKGIDGIRLDLKLGTLDAMGRRINDVDFRSALQDGTWRSSIKSREMEGDIDWRPRGQGRVVARMKQFTLPEASPWAQIQAQNLARLQGQGAAPPPREAKRAADLPELDLVADSFIVRDKNLGRLELTAANLGRDWNIEKLVLANPDGGLQADGVWQNYAIQSRTSLNIHLESSDIGKLLDRLGFAGTMRRGQATLEGRVSWVGNPQSIDYPSLSGNLKVDAKQGQFSKIEPGIGKLLGILSLQSIPRRITLDFRDVFSDGFAFDQITGKVDIAHGVMSTSDLKIDGPSAKVEISGSANLVGETQNLRIRVLPTVGEGVSLAGALLINPIVGLATLVAQKILRDPLSQILAFEYGVTGTWDDPKVEKLHGPQPADSSSSPAPAAPAKP